MTPDKMTNYPNLDLLFDQFFKHRIEDSVYHKSDTRSELGADLGLLIVAREMKQIKTDTMCQETGNLISSFSYDKIYICRMIRYGGSGEIGAFRELELMSQEDYDIMVAIRTDEKNKAREEVRRRSNEIFAHFGVRRGEFVYLRKGLKPEAEVQNNVKYVVVGFQVEADVYKLKVRPQFHKRITPDNADMAMYIEKDTYMSLEEFNTLNPDNNPQSPQK